MNKDVIVSVRIAGYLLKQIESAMVETGFKKSELIRQALTEYLTKFVKS